MADTGAELLRCDKLTLAFGPKLVQADVSFSVGTEQQGDGSWISFGIVAL